MNVSVVRLLNWYIRGSGKYACPRVPSDAQGPSDNAMALDSKDSILASHNRTSGVCSFLALNETHAVPRKIGPSIRIANQPTHILTFIVHDEIIRCGKE